MTTMREYPTGRIQAIVYVRENNPNMTLREAKDFMERSLGLTNSHARWDEVTVGQLERFMHDAKFLAKATLLAQLHESVAKFNVAYGTNYSLRDLDAW